MTGIRAALVAFTSTPGCDRASRTCIGSGWSTLRAGHIVLCRCGGCGRPAPAQQQGLLAPGGRPWAVGDVAVHRGLLVEVRGSVLADGTTLVRFLPGAGIHGTDTPHVGELNAE